MRRLARIGRPGDLTYADYGLTEQGHAPAGYRTVRRRLRVGNGEAAYRRLADGILDWDLHRGAGLTVPKDTPRATPGVRVVSGMGIGPLRVPAPCRVLWSSEPDSATTPDAGERRAGFGYGTLKGHPVAGEESFTAVLDREGTVWFEVLAYSRPANWLMRAATPVTQRTQELVTRAYFRAARELATSSRT
nr:DUF1990 domain-containing protein [Arthrobacter rhombi]